MIKHIKSIPYKEQRYPTCGDYWIESGTVQFRVNEFGNEDFEFLVSIHEQIEEHLTRRRGLKEPEILAFDLEWEKERENGKHSYDEEPGHDLRAPYHREHVLAENIERMLCLEMGLSWAEYDQAVYKSCDEDHPSETKT